MDYFDDYDDSEFEDDDPGEDGFCEDAEDDGPFDGDTEPDGDFNEPEPNDDFTPKDAFIIGSAMGFAYEEGLEEGEQRKRKKTSDDDV